jgi:hypothetical protein
VMEIIVPHNIAAVAGISPNVPWRCIIRIQGNMMNMVVLKYMFVSMDIYSLKVGIIDLTMRNFIATSVHIDSCPKEFIPPVVFVYFAVVNIIISVYQFPFAASA